MTTGMKQLMADHACGMYLTPDRVHSWVKWRCSACNKALLTSRAKVKETPMHDLPEHQCWMNMRNRCSNPSNTHYGRYGGRGIKVCDRWKDSFENFYADMGPRPTARHTIDRIDNDLGYEPGNCRWATKAQQAANTSRTIRVTVDGEEMSLHAACRKLGIRPLRAWRWLKKMPWNGVVQKLAGRAP